MTLKTKLWAGGSWKAIPAPINPLRTEWWAPSSPRFRVQVQQCSWQPSTALPTSGTATAAKQTPAVPGWAGLASRVPTAPSPAAPHIPACPGQLVFVIHQTGPAPAVQPPAGRHSRSHTQISPRSSSSGCRREGWHDCAFTPFPSDTASHLLWGGDECSLIKQNPTPGGEHGGDGVTLSCWGFWCWLCQKFAWVGKSRAASRSGVGAHPTATSAPGSSASADINHDPLTKQKSPQGLAKPV